MFIGWFLCWGIDSGYIFGFLFVLLMSEGNDKVLDGGVVMEKFRMWVVLVFEDDSRVDLIV